MQFDQLKRREFIALLGGGAVVWPLQASAQQSSLALIGLLNAGAATTLKREIDAFCDGLRNLGYIEGRNIRFEYRFADGYLDRLPTLAAELVRLNPNVVVSSPVPANLAIARLTSTIPIVMASGADPVGFGLVKSLSHPGGNVTGLTNFAEELASKQIDLMRELLPGLARLAALVNVANPLHVPQWRETQAAAAQAAIALVPFELRSPDQLEEAFARFARERADALIVPPDVTFTTHRRRIANLALGARLPTIFFVRQSVEDGGLMSYGPNQVENYRRAATYVDKILKGAKPQDLPIERPTNFDLIINLTTAKALGLDVPATLLARADEVIE
ncbi:MAG: ABC transporter substrate-binding protein [Xanthobacteraceae bacterium]|jgi:putative tryptophan/tyrosine transport system substrate-binding protein